MPSLSADNKGAVAIIFALAILPIMGLMGAAIDYSWASLERSRLQKAIDGTALALAKIMPASQATLDARGGDFFRANMGSTPLTNVQLVIAPGAGRLDLTVTATYHTVLFNVLGVSSFQVGARTETQWGFKKLEIALALDNTGSMAWSGKLTELKKAVRDLLAKMQAAAQSPDSVKVAIVPFDTTVNIGTSYRDEFWIDYNDEHISKFGWEGCVIDRDQSYDVQDAAPISGRNATYYPAANCGSLVRLLPLTNNWTTLNDKVTAMQAAGNTNVTIGLVWAWHALTPNLVLTGAAAPNADLDKVIIVLTDGENTENRWTTSRSSIDARTRAACTNIKAAGIRVYSIRVIEGNASLLRDCASSADDYYEVQDAAQLSAVFSAIGDKLVQLHLAK